MRPRAGLHLRRCARIPASLLYCAIEKKLKPARLDRSTTQALNVLKSICVVDTILATARPNAP